MFSRLSTPKRTTNPLTLWSPQPQQSQGPPAPATEQQGYESVDGEKTAVLHVESLDMCFEKNGQDQFTSKYEVMRRRDPDTAHLVVRRGQPFQLRLCLDRPYNPSDDIISLTFIFKAARRPNFGCGTFLSVPVDTDNTKIINQWQAVLTSTQGNTITVNVTPAVSSIIGVWMVEVDTMLKSDGSASCFSPRSNIYILFNAWCPEDLVYLEHEEKRQEYVVSDMGAIWRESDKSRPSSWLFAQYETNILDCALYLIVEVGKVPIVNCNNPIKIARALSSAYVEHWGCQPDQSLCFSPALTGMVVSPLTLYDEKSNKLPKFSDDSAWNFHVWNEVWMKRPDLYPGDYDGWNALDSTPSPTPPGQEAEYLNSVKHYGPASVKAIQRGEVMKPYETEFIYGAVNAHHLVWMYSLIRPLQLLSVEKNWYGKHISTKKIGSSMREQREDITHTYKHEQGSEHALTLKNMEEYSKFNSRFVTTKTVDIKLYLELIENDIGSPFSVSAKIKNNSNENHTFSLITRFETKYYNSHEGSFVKLLEEDVMVTSKSVGEKIFSVAYEEYMDELVDGNFIKVTCFGKANDSEIELIEEVNYHINSPEIRFHIDHDPVQGELCAVTAVFTNPLPHTLTEGEFHFDELSLKNPVVIYIDENVEPKGEVSATFKIRFEEAGERRLIGKFNSPQLREVEGSILVNVADKES